MLLNTRKIREGLYLIGIRDVETGKEASYITICHIANLYGIPTTKIFDKTLEKSNE